MRRQEAFFDYARERYSIFLRRRPGVPPPYTKDKILQQYRFCNVFREDDATTRWFRKNVRDVLRSKTEVLLATVVFRMFNRIDTGEAVFCQTDIEGGTPFELFMRDGNVGHLRHAIRVHLGDGPYVTSAYIISSPPGYSKLDGVLEVLRRFWMGKQEWRGLGAGIMDTMGWGGEEGAAQMMLCNPGTITLEATWEWLRQFDYLGKFHSYEIVTDLRHTALLERAPDIMTWANPGPGARRGLCWMLGKTPEYRISREDQIKLMRELLMSSRDNRMWPSKWPQWELREVEHTLCEVWKFQKVKLGIGRPRGTFR